jgi:hypothetical protein
MQTIPLEQNLFQGHISLEYGPGWVQPWRLPYDKSARKLTTLVVG